MVGTRSQQDLSGPVPAAGLAAEARARPRRGLRVALLCLATAILLLGAATAAIFGYLIVSRGAA